MFDHWMNAGAISGVTPFNSYPKWAEVVGGVMKVCGLGDPCLPHQEDETLLGGDMREKAMRILFDLCFSDWPKQWLKKSDISDVLIKYQQTDERLSWFGDLNDKQAAGTKLGKALVMFNKRILGGIQLAIDTSKVKSNQWGYYFDKP